MTILSDTALDIASTVSLVLSSSLESTERLFQYEEYRHAREEVVRKFKSRFPSVRTPSGAYRTALIFDDFVVKFSKDTHRQECITQEAEFITAMREDEKFARHFPETHVVQVGIAPVLIQEKVYMKHAGISWEMRSEVERLAEYLGISDMHEENYGWAGPAHKPYPVFVDVDLRFGPGRRPSRHRRSWFI
jgi:hypothetical protein